MNGCSQGISSIHFVNTCSGNESLFTSNGSGWIEPEGIPIKTIIVIAVLITILISGLAWMKMPRIKTKKFKPGDDIIEYLKPNLEKGYTPEEIKKGLIEKGWDKEKANKIYKELKRFKNQVN